MTNCLLCLPDSMRHDPFLVRYKNWDHGLLFYKDDCQGKYQREICILGVGDIPPLVTGNHLFANKFVDDFQPAGLDCLEEWYFNRTRAEHRGDTEFDTMLYSQQDVVLHQITV